MCTGGTAALERALLEWLQNCDRMDKPDCPNCDSAQRPELLAYNGAAPYRVWVYLCKCCSRTWVVKEAEIQRMGR
ncbi:MAG TPA: hypothetical protein VNJ02_10485 [Vicinamibacterales bacterium]|nr:hypothetical protein [Vicinamibacterales bacterium]